MRAKQMCRLLRSILIPLLVSAGFLFAGGARAQTPAPASVVPNGAAPLQKRTLIVKAYTLPPEEYAKAVSFARARYRLYFVRFGYGLLLLWAMLAGRIAPMFRDLAERISARRVVQVAVVVPLVLLTLDILRLPLRMHGQWLARRYDISVQGWGSWFWDWTKGELLNLVFATFLAWILFGVVRRSPRRWWFYFWLAAVPLTLFLVFLAPVVIDPLYYRFQPLAQEHPQLTSQIEAVAERGGLRISPERIFEMKASAKLKAVNAYVTGLGSTKRVVVWDTTLRKMNDAQVLAVFGHEMGHYVLGHVRDGVLLSLGGLLIGLYVLHRALDWTLARRGPAWRIRGADDYAALPVLLLGIALLNFATTPLENAISRRIERQADVYGLEVTHGIVPDAPQVAAQTHQILGEINLEEPDPSAFIQFWFYSHPPTKERLKLALEYNPWAQGRPPQFVK